MEPVGENFWPIHAGGAAEKEKDERIGAGNGLVPPAVVAEHIEFSVVGIAILGGPGGAAGAPIESGTN